MPIKSTIDPEARMIYTVCTDVMKEEDLVIYQQELWGHNKYYGFNELFDTTQADWSKINFGDLLTVAKIASELKTIDPESKLAWIVLEGKQKELTDFYKAAKSLITTSSRQLEAFYSKQDAINWLEK